MVSNLLFAKDQTSKVTNQELQMLYSGLEDEIRRARDIPIQSVQTNPGNMEGSPYRKSSISWKGGRSLGLVPGFLLAGTWSVPLSGTQGPGSCPEAGENDTGYFGIDLRSYAVNHEIEYIDTPYLIACHILRDKHTYKFADSDGNMLYCKLPQPHLTNFSTIENICFLPDPEFMCADP
ncbi:hypothetical protein F2Q68_00015593 [Brassica cretica]|nr:hypothetical protein F2Q68_00015593 [Brassica cretica]